MESSCAVPGRYGVLVPRRHPGTVYVAPANTPGGTTITFGYASSPVTAQGLQTMHLDAGAFTRAGDGSPVTPFDVNFRYDAVPLQVTSTNPPAGGTFTLPGPFTFDVTFNEPVDASSVCSSGTVPVTSIV